MRSSALLVALFALTSITLASPVPMQEMAGGIISARDHPIIRKNAVMKRGRETMGEDEPTRRGESYMVVKRTEEIEESDGPTRRDESHVVVKRIEETKRSDSGRRDESYVYALAAV